MNTSFQRWLGSILMITGTTLGAGMLNLPVQAASFGYLNSLMMVFLGFALMYACALYLLEVALHTPQERANLISMSGMTLGPWGQRVAWFLYLMLLYSLIGSYLIGAGDWLQDSLRHIYATSLPLPGLQIALAFVLSLFLMHGHQRYDWLNRALMTGLLLTLVYLMITSFSSQSAALQQAERSFSIDFLTLTLLSFGYSIVIPTVVHLVQDDARLAYSAVFWGSLIPLILYTLWIVAILRALPWQGSQGLLEIQTHGQTISGLRQALSASTQAPYLGQALRGLSFFALTTSLLGITLSLFDFLADGLKIRPQGLGALSLCALIFIPPLFFSCFHPYAFAYALKVAGIWVTMLLGVLPCFMVLKSRHLWQKNARYRAPGGPMTLRLLCLFFLGISLYQAWQVF